MSGNTKVYLTWYIVSINGASPESIGASRPSNKAISDALATGGYSVCNCTAFKSRQRFLRGRPGSIDNQRTQVTNAVKNAWQTANPGIKFIINISLF